MHQKRVVSLILLSAVILVSGCKSVRIKTDTTKQLTGIAGDDHEKFMVIMKTIQVDKTTRTELEDMGIRPGKVPNVKSTTGSGAAIQAAVASGVNVQINLSTLLDDIVKYREVELVSVPFTNIKTTSKRFYWSDNFKEVKGHDTMFLILLNRGTVIALLIPKDEKMDTMSRSHAFGKGFIELFGEATGPARAIRGALP